MLLLANLDGDRLKDLCLFQALVLGEIDLDMSLSSSDLEGGVVGAFMLGCLPKIAGGMF